MKPLKRILHGRPIPIYLAAVGLKSVEQAAEIADGWLPIFYSPYRAPKVYGPAIAAGLAKAGKAEKDFDIAAGPTVTLASPSSMMAGPSMRSPGFSASAETMRADTKPLASAK